MKTLIFLISLLVPVFSFAVPGGQWVTQTVSVSTTGAKFLNAKTSRQYLLIVNKGAATIYMKSGSLPGAGEGIPIPAGGNYEPAYPPHGDVYLKSSSGTQSVELIDG